MLAADPMFPQLTKALNPELMGPLLSWTLNQPGRRSGKDCCLIGEKRYKPGKRVLIGYRLEAIDGANKNPIHATGYLCPPGRAGLAYQQETALRPELAHGGLRYLHDPAMLLWVFPYDRKLQYLPALVNPDSLRPRLEPVLAALGLAASAVVFPINGEVLHYLPERSCMLRYRFCYAESASSRRDSVLVYGKHYVDHAGAETFAVMQQLNRQFVYGARALAYDGELRTLWQSHLPGAPLSWAHMASDLGDAIADRIGFCVARFHACKIDTGARWTQQEVEQALRDTADIAERAVPDLYAVIRDAVAGLLAATPSSAGQQIATVHHDLKLNNLLWDGEGIHLIDMDCVCLGDPLTDLASLIANLYLNGLREGADLQKIHSLANRLVIAYRHYGTHVVVLSSLRWQVAAALLHEVLRRGLRQLDTRRMAHLQTYLALSERYLALSNEPEHCRDALIG